MSFFNKKKPSDTQTSAELTDEQIRAESAFLEGVPRLNIAAFLMPPIWGPVHGIWVTILYYPLWLLADNCFVNAVVAQTPLAIVLAVIVALILLLMTTAFSIISQPFALHRAVENGVSKETYLRRQRIWAVAMAVVAVIAIGAATYYNLCINPDIQAVL